MTVIGTDWAHRRVGRGRCLQPYRSPITAHTRQATIGQPSSLRSSEARSRHYAEVLTQGISPTRSIFATLLVPGRPDLSLSHSQPCLLRVLDSAEVSDLTSLNHVPLRLPLPPAIYFLGPKNGEPAKAAQVLQITLCYAHKELLNCIHHYGQLCCV